MTVHCKIQRAHFYPDQYEDLGPVSLEQAIQVFQKFPWEEEMETVHNREMTSAFPTILYEVSHGQELMIYMAQEDWLNVHFKAMGMYADYRVSRYLMANTNGIPIEDALIQFFSGTLKESLEMKPISDSGSDVTYSGDKVIYKRTIGRTLNFMLIVLPVLLATAFTLYSLSTSGYFAHSPEVAIILLGLIAIIFGPFIYQFVAYATVNHRASVYIYPKKKAIAYIDNKRSVVFTRDEIENCTLKVSTAKYLYRTYSVLRIKLKDGRKVCITTLLTDHKGLEDILNSLGLHYRSEYMYCPGIR